ncbi:MAG: Rho termination factor N-terminal domain-containing protein, partial [Chitinophagaceae bacterium]
MPVNKNASTYDKEFEQGSPNPWDIFQQAKGPGLDITYGTTDYGQDITNESYISKDYDWYNAFDSNEERAQNQPISHKIARGVGRIGVEIAANILQMPGYIGGAIAGGINALSGGEGSMDMFVNNSWVDSLEAVKDYYNNDLAPVHIKNAVRDGNLWDNVSSVDFWATEGASGLAFLLSAFAPGAAITKFGTGLKMANAIGKSSLFGEGSGLKLLMKMDKVAKAAGLQTAENAINVVGATVANTLYESGTEADGALKDLRDSLGAKLAAGEIDEVQYEKLMAGAPTQAAKVFRDNLGILLLPNLMMSKALFGKAVSSKALDAFETVGTKITPNLVATTVGKRAGNIGKEVGKAFISEAVIEEGGQATTTNYHTDNYIDDFLSGKEGKSAAETYMDMLDSTEGQKAMFLGTLFGSGAYAFGASKNYKATNQQRTKLAELMTSGANFFESAIDGIYKKDEAGKTIFDEQNQPIIDTEKILELGSNIDFINKVNSEKNVYKALAEQGVEGAQEKVDILDRTITNNMLYTFTHAGEEGIAVLKNYLENSPAIDNLLEQTNEGKEKKLTKGEFVSGFVKEAETLQKDIEFFDKYGNFKNKLIKNNEDLPYYDKYSKVVTNKYAAVKSNLRYLEKATSDTKEAISTAKTDLKVTEIAKSQEAKDNFEQSTVKELKALAKEQNIEGYNKLRKAELVDALTDSQDYIEEANDLINSLNGKLKSIFDLRVDNERELKGLSDVRKQDEAYNKFKKNEVERENAEVEAAELDDVLNKIRNTTNKTEANQIPIPDKFKTGNAAKAIAKVRAETEEVWSAKKTEKNKVDQQASQVALAEEEQAKAELAQKADTIAKQYNEGEQVPTEQLGTDPAFDTFKSADENGLVLANEAGETITIPINQVYDKIHDEDDQFTTETTVTVDTFEPDSSIENPNNIKENNDARVVITDNKKTGPVSVLFSDLQEAYKFELSPKDKRGYYGISVNPALSNEATKRYEKEGVTEGNFQFLLDNLPLAINLEEGVTAPLENKTKGDTKIYEDTTEKLKKVILKELQKGTDIKDISIEITGQYSGKIQLEVDENGYPVENKISDLYYFAGDWKNINIDDIYVVGDNGTLVNHEGKGMRTRRQDFPAGEIYIKIKMANGASFPLKLNTTKVSKDVAEFLHQLYVQRSDEIAKERPENVVGKQALLMANGNQIAEFKRLFPQEFKIITDQVGVKDLRIKHIIDFFIFDNTTNPVSRVKFDRGVLKVGAYSFTNEELRENKEGFVNALTEVKRRQVTLKKHKKHNYDFGLTNPAVLEYIIENKILNTNAKLESKVFEKEGLNDPIFKDRTTMYLDTRTVKVKDELSQFNEADVVSYRKDLFGSSIALEKVAPQLFADGLELDTEVGLYLTANDRKAVETYANDPKVKRTPAEVLAYKKTKGKERVSSLIPFTGVEDASSIAGQIRGDVVDTLIREFFNPLQQVNTDERFAERGLDLLEKENRKKDGQVQISKEWFQKQLWPVVKMYGHLFDQEGYTVYSDEFPVMFTMNGKQYAGTGDLLVYDNKKKQWGLIDIKTSSISREEDYKRKNGWYKDKDSKQQNAYREAYKQTAKINIAFSKIMPLQTAPTTKGNSNNYIGAEVGIGKKVTGNTLFDHLLDVSQDKTIFELLNKTEEKGSKINVSDMQPTAKIEAAESTDAADLAALAEAGGSLMDMSDWVTQTEEKTPVAQNKVESKVESVQQQTVLDKFKTQLGNKDMYPNQIFVTTKGRKEGKPYFLSNAKFENGELVGGLIAMDIENKTIVVDKTEYIA